MISSFFSILLSFRKIYIINFLEKNLKENIYLWVVRDWLISNFPTNLQKNAL